MSSVYYYVVGKHGNMYYKNGHEISKEQTKGHVVPKRNLTYHRTVYRSQRQKQTKLELDMDMKEWLYTI